jgi:lipooligosaccharide transport system permease protein
VEMVLRQYDYWRTVYKRTWKGSVITSFVQPLFYVAAMGVLLGGYVDKSGTASLEGASSYLDFVAPGLLAAQAMQVAAGEVMWPVMDAVKWHKTYFGMVATPLRASDVVAAHLTFVLFRIALTCGVFAVVLAPFGVYASPAGAVVAFLASVLVGMAFAAPIYAYSAGARSEEGFALIYRLGVMPMFLFSGAFFPITNLSPPLEAVARLTPLWHGVDLARMATLGTFELSVALVHVAYLTVLCALGCWWAGRRLRKRLVT